MLEIRLEPRFLVNVILAVSRIAVTPMCVLHVVQEVTIGVMRWEQRVYQTQVARVCKELHDEKRNSKSSSPAGFHLDGDDGGDGDHWYLGNHYDWVVYPDYEQVARCAAEK